MAIAARCDFVQIREKDLSSRTIFDLAKNAVADGAKGASARVLLNDRLDIAMASGAAGVHLGASSLPLRETRRYAVNNAAPDFLVGVSCHSLEEARAAEKEGANYIFFGPIFDTPSKRAFGLPQGLDRLKKVCASVKILVVAIGGVNESNAAQCVEVGAGGIAAIRMIQAASDGTALAMTIARIHALKKAES